MERFLTKFKWNTNTTRRPELFNGQYVKALSRIPSIGEHIRITNHPTPYKVVDVITELKGWDDYYIIVLE